MGPGRQALGLERPAEWAMGLLAADDWRAQWIAATPDGGAHPSSIANA